MNVYPARAPEWLVVERKILAELAAGIQDQVKKISQYPSATHLIPIRDALSEIAKITFVLEDITKL